MLKKLTPIPPGEILLEEFLRPARMSQNELARAVGVAPGRINDIIRGKRGITRDTASRLAVYWRTTPDLWINLQARYDAKIAARDLMPAVAKQIRPHRQTAA
jgi:addiction module HigA family antidote